jgi:hypothetical protein
MFPIPGTSSRNEERRGTGVGTTKEVKEIDGGTMRTGTGSDLWRKSLGRLVCSPPAAAASIVTACRLARSRSTDTRDASPSVGLRAAHRPLVAAPPLGACRSRSSWAQPASPPSSQTAPPPASSAPDARRRGCEEERCEEERTPRCREEEERSRSGSFQY